MLKVLKDFKSLEGRKIYISGKMTGLTVSNIFKNFNKAEDILLKYKAHPMNPAIMWYLKDPSGFDIETHLKIDFAMLDTCDSILMLPDWPTSKEAQEEMSYAQSKGKTFFYLTEDYKEILYNS